MKNINKKLLITSSSIILAGAGIAGTVAYINNNHANLNEAIVLSQDTEVTRNVNTGSTGKTEITIPNSTKIRTDKFSEQKMEEFLNQSTVKEQLFTNLPSTSRIEIKPSSYDYLHFFPNGKIVLQYRNTSAYSNGSVVNTPGEWRNLTVSGFKSVSTFWQSFDTWFFFGKMTNLQEVVASDVNKDNTSTDIFKQELINQNLIYNLYPNTRLTPKDVVIVDPQADDVKGTLTARIQVLNGAMKRGVPTPYFISNDRLIFTGFKKVGVEAPNISTQINDFTITGFDNVLPQTINKGNKLNELKQAIVDQGIVEPTEITVEKHVTVDDFNIKEGWINGANYNYYDNSTGTIQIPLIFNPRTIYVGGVLNSTSVEKTITISGFKQLQETSFRFNYNNDTIRLVDDFNNTNDSKKLPSSITRDNISEFIARKGITTFVNNPVNLSSQGLLENSWLKNTTITVDEFYPNDATGTIIANAHINWWSDPRSVIEQSKFFKLELTGYLNSNDSGGGNDNNEGGNDGDNNDPNLEYKGTEDNWWIWVIVGVGSGLLLIAIIVIIIMLAKKRKHEVEYYDWY